MMSHNGSLPNYAAATSPKQVDELRRHVGIAYGMHSKQDHTAGTCPLSCQAAALERLLPAADGSEQDTRACRTSSLAEAVAA